MRSAGGGAQAICCLWRLGLGCRPGLFPKLCWGGPPSLLIPPPHPFPCVRKHLLSSGQDGKRKRRATSGQTWPLTLRWQRRSGTGHPGPVGMDVWALAQGEWRASEGPCHGGDCLELPAPWRAVPLFLIPLCPPDPVHRAFCWNDLDPFIAAGTSKASS